MRTSVLLAVVLAAVLSPGLSSAQDSGPKPEVRVFSGAYIPTGPMRDILKDAAIVGSQLGVEIASRVHGVASVGWAFSSNPELTENDAVHIFQYDVGLEVFQSFDLNDSWEIRPYLGAGGGGRTYRFGLDQKESQSDPVGYGALGAEVQLERVAFRVEGRDYITRFEGMDVKEDARTRNDIFISAGISYHLK